MSELIALLESPAGVQLMNAAAILMVAIAGWISYRTHQDVQRVKDTVVDNQKQNDHILRLMGSDPQDVVGSQKDPIVPQ